MSSLVHRFIQPLRNSAGLFRAIRSAFRLLPTMYQHLYFSGPIVVLIENELALNDPSAVEGWHASALQRSVRFSPAAAHSKWLAVPKG